MSEKVVMRIHGEIEPLIRQGVVRLHADPSTSIVREIKRRRLGELYERRARGWHSGLGALFEHRRAQHQTNHEPTGGIAP